MSLTPILSLIPATRLLTENTVAETGSPDTTRFADLVLSLAPVPQTAPEMPQVIAMAALDYAHIIAMCGYALTVATLLPGLKARSETFRFYSDSAAAAMSRIRCTIARNPLDR